MTIDPQAGPPTLPPGAAPERTASGLEYFELEAGDGAVVETGFRVRVHYYGWLTDGTLFGQTHGADPLEYTTGDEEVIAALEEGVVGMKVGGRRRLIAPSDLAYGPQGHEPAIPPYATLIFDVTLEAAK